MKFTPTGGEIEISFAIVTRQEAEEFFCLTEQDKSVRYIRISVTNTGENIPEEQLEKIFERFYQIKGNKGTYNWGTGIGLVHKRGTVLWQKKTHRQYFHRTCENRTGCYP